MSTTASKAYGEHNMKIIINEKQGNHGQTLNLIKGTNGIHVVSGDLTRSGENDRFTLSQKIQHFLVSVFLPNGFPTSVSPDYIPYQIWDTIQAFASSLTGALSTRAVLEGVGVGSSTSTPLAATITWLIKDGTGMLGRIGFAWWKGTSLDADSKKWRLFADFLNDTAICMELCAPFVLAASGGPGAALTGLLCAAGSAKAIVGVAGGATRAALTQHQARCGNLADVSAKDGSQETLVNLAALVTSLWLLPLIADSPFSTWALFILFTFLHLYANYRAVRSVVMPTLNRSRFLILLQRYIGANDVLGVKRTNAKEPVFLGVGLSEEDVCGWKLRCGEPVSHLLKNYDVYLLKQLLTIFTNKNYIIIPDEEHKMLHLVFRKNCSSQDYLEAYYNAILLGSIKSGKVNSGQLSEMHGDLIDLLKHVVNNKLEDLSWSDFSTRLLSKGWNLNQSLLALGEWRANWEI